MRKLRLTDAESRDAAVIFLPVAVPPGPTPGLPAEEVEFRRVLAATEACLHEALLARFGGDYAQELIDGDPEVALEDVGRRVGPTSTVYLSSTGDVMYAPPQIVEVITAPDGSEKERRAPIDVLANVTEEDPVRWTRMRLKRADAIHRLAFSRTLQIRHSDGLTYDYLHRIAKSLDEADEMVLIAAGPKARDPLVFQFNGSPWRSFLEGRVDGQRYQLLLHLSNLELKIPGGAS